MLTDIEHVVEMFHDYKQNSVIKHRRRYLGVCNQSNIVSDPRNPRDWNHRRQVQVVCLVFP